MVAPTANNTGPDELLPLTDPEAIIRAGNAENRRTKQLQAISTAPRLPDSTKMSDETTPTHKTSGSTRTADAADMQTAKDWFKSVFKIQHTAIIEAQADRRQAAEDRRQALEDRRTDRQILISAHQSNAARIARLEDLLLAMNIKNKANAHPIQPAPGRVDLQKFRTSDGPIYRGPFQETKPFLRWIHGVQIFFDTKDVSNAADKIRIVGNLIAETNLQSFYANEATGFLTKSWEEFKTRLFDFALPSNWRSNLQRQVRKLEMSSSETFLEYSTRARTLQSLFNFDAVASAKLGDLQLAQFLVYGLTDALQDRINGRQLLETVPFAYGPFEKQANTSFLALQRPAGTPASLRPSLNTSPNLSRDEFIWRVHSFLESRGLCHFCKKHCGNVNGGCPGPLNRAHVDIPANYQAPAKPADYSAPHAWSNPSGPSSTPGKPTQPPAGRPSTRAASVAGITDVTPLEAQVSALQLDAAIREDDRWDTYFDDEGCYPSMDPAAVAALEDLDKQLLANEIEKAEQADLADAIAGCPGRA
ncbi:hypothetical protein PGT21_032527 [Puccinia graminis f. sp. tritici]|uniref:Retrotransposon gag domain-containing protein n=1 Tax=Puccinia graminis f. sp. tritici TaxID=56615 RepID=A0A5B0R2P1_PUCGR|nr:hypothetical protein PGT21_032527 [Puccinia graminis f. sp. tritici]